MQSNLLIGAREFMDSLAQSSGKAQKSFYVQAMTFEGDDAGEELIKLMMASPATDKRLQIDSFSKAVINDHFVFGTHYLTDKQFREEIRNTKKIIKKAEEKGINVQFTNPLGFLMHKYPFRNHKKMVILDEKESYLGGVNFSDHNFEWHDMMIKLEDAQVGRVLAADFKSTWNGENQSAFSSTDDLDLYFLDGTSSYTVYEKLFSEITSAKKTVKIISPYLSEPLLTILKSMKPEIDLLVVTPKDNNKSIFKDLMMVEYAKHSFDLRWYPGMSHLKSILIDDEKLIFGSSNFDFVSFLCEQEVVAISKDKNLIQNFVDAFFKAEYEKASQIHISFFRRMKVRTLSLITQMITRPSRFI